MVKRAGGESSFGMREHILKSTNVTSRGFRHDAKDLEGQGLSDNKAVAKRGPVAFHKGSGDGIGRRFFRFSALLNSPIYYTNAYLEEVGELLDPLAAVLKEHEGH